MHPIQFKVSYYTLIIIEPFIQGYTYKVVEIIPLPILVPLLPVISSERLVFYLTKEQIMGGVANSK